MSKPTVRIMIPKMVVVKDDTNRALARTIGQMLLGAVERKDIDEKTANRLLDSLKLEPETRDFPIVDLLTRIVDTAPVYHSGNSKLKAQAFRIVEAFEGAVEGKIVEISKDAHDNLKAWLDKPEYEIQGQNGKFEVVKGWPPSINPYLARITVPYQEAVMAPLTDEQFEKLAVDSEEKKPEVQAQAQA